MTSTPYMTIRKFGQPVERPKSSTLKKSDLHSKYSRVASRSTQRKPRVPTQQMILAKAYSLLSKNQTAYLQSLHGRQNRTVAIGQREPLSQHHLKKKVDNRLRKFLPKRYMESPQMVSSYNLKRSSEQIPTYNNQGCSLTAERAIKRHNRKDSVGIAQRPQTAKKGAPPLIQSEADTLTPWDSSHQIWSF